MTITSRAVRHFFIPVLLAALAGAAPATAQEPYKPTVGQAGRDAVWVPTTQAMVEKMLDVARVTPTDFVIDLGSGDGRMVVAAAKRGARALGVEFNAELVALSKRAAAEAGVADKAAFAQGDMFAADISKATVLALFLLPSNIEKLAPKFLALPAGSRIVANTFWIEEWEADETQTMNGDCDSWCTVKLFIVPARIEGKWRTETGELTLTQKYQVVTGTFASARGGNLAVQGRLRGDRVTLTIDNTEYEGRVAGDTMEGAPKTGGPAVKAVRVK